MNKTFRQTLFALLLIGSLFVAGCQQASQSANNTNQPGEVACTREAKLCPDGSSVGREGPNCEFAACPGEDLSGEKRYVGNSPEQCQTIRFICEEGTEYFSDEQGCGCMSATEPEKHYPTAEDRAAEFCTEEYRPVCGWFNSSVQCIKYPCAATFGNSCEAGKDPIVAYWTEGVCPGDEAMNPEGPDPMELRTECTEPRRQACTKEYNPVCGSDGETYGNGCSACATEDVDYHTPGECKAGREYVNRDLAVCAASTWLCEEGQQQFYDETGCGCEPAAPTGREYVNTDPNQCAATDWLCDAGEQQFYDDTGCGCEPATAAGKKQAIDCTEPRPEACTMQYDPVCGQQEGGSTATYGNNCAACADANVVSYYAGECTNGTGSLDREYKSRDAEQCKAMLFVCEEGKEPFFDETGCGCVAQ